MLCSDEEIPRVEPVIKYKLKFSRDCGEDRLIVKKILMDPKHESSLKAIKKKIPAENNEINNSAQKHKVAIISPFRRNDGASLSSDKRLSMRKSAEKLNDQSITEILCDSDSSVDSDCSEAIENVSQKASVISSPKSKARERWIEELRREDLGSLKKPTKRNTSKTSRRSLVYDSDVDQDDCKKSKEILKKNTSKIVDHKHVGNESVAGGRRSQRMSKTKYDALEWDVGSPGQKNNRRTNRNAVGSKRQQSSDEDSSEYQPVKRRMPSRLESKSVGSPNLKNNRRANKNASESIVQLSSSEDASPNCRPLKRRVAALRCKSIKAASPCQKSNKRLNTNAVESKGQLSCSDEDSSDYEQRKTVSQCKMKSLEWDVGSPGQKNNRRANRNAVGSKRQQSSDEDSSEYQPVKRRMPSSRLESKSVGSPNLKNNRRANKNASESIVQLSSSEDASPNCRPLKRRVAALRCKSIKAASPCQKSNRRLNTNAVESKGQLSSSDEDSSDYEQKKPVSQCKIKSKSKGIESEAKEAFKTSEKRVLKTSTKANELSNDSLSRDNEIFTRKQTVICSEKKHDGDSAKSKETHRKRVTGRPPVEENEMSSSDGDSPVKSPVKNKKVAMIENSSLKGSPAKSTNKTPVKDDCSSQRCAVPTSPHITHNKKNQNEYTPKRKLIASGIDRTAEKNLTPTTPSTRRTGLKRLLCTPSMPVCKRDLGTPHTPLQQAMTKLHVSAVPQSLPCREAEFANVHRFLEGKILDGAGGCIYVSGVPGTGKTATVREVVRSLKQDVQKGDLPDFQFIEINGMRLSHPRQAYVQLWKALASETVTAEQAQRLLESKFTKSSKNQMSIVVLVDEVDVLWTKRQDVVYNLLDWPTKAKSHLVVITIANTMDLPERLLMGRVTSRLGLTRLTFQPYSHKQLEEIVKARLQGINAFDPDAIQFVSRKVASVSGDARRALDICRRATEIAEQDSPDALVTIKHVDEAMLTMTSSHSVQAIVHACSTMEKLFLQAVDAELTRTGLEETTFCRAFKTMETLCCLEGLQLPPASLVMKACMNLSSMRLLLSQHSNMDIYTRIFLNVSSDDLHYALKCVRNEL